MEYPIRILNIVDFDDIIDLWARCGLKYRRHGRDSFEAISHQMARAETCFLGMHDCDRLIGVVIGSSDGRKGWINRLAVDPDYRGLGLAGKLIGECENYLHGLDLKVIAALIEDWNSPSIAAFTKAGYAFGEGILYFSRRSEPED
jgi:GNAT superfamily N-acetyltransferase